MSLTPNPIGAAAETGFTDSKDNAKQALRAKINISMVLESFRPVFCITAPQ
jgi:hypothetical protein